MKTFSTSIYNPYLHFTYGSSAMEHSSIHVTQNSNSIMKTTQMQAITRNNDSQIYIYFCHIHFKFSILAKMLEHTLNLLHCKHLCLPLLFKYKPLHGVQIQCQPSLWTCPPKFSGTCQNIQWTLTFSLIFFSQTVTIILTNLNYLLKASKIKQLSRHLCQLILTDSTQREEYMLARFIFDRTVEKQS